MNNNLFEKFKALNLPIGEYAIFGSGPMAIRGLREPTDIDLVVTEKFFEELEKSSQWKKEKSCLGSDMLVHREPRLEVEALTEWMPGVWDIEGLIKNADIIDGLAFVKLEEVLRWKKMRDKEKDKKDTEAIEEYLNKKI
jgi:hypothetical protein